MTTALYDVSVRKPDAKAHKIACVRAVRSKGPVGNYFPAVADIMTPDTAAIHDALPHYWRKAWDRSPCLWHTADTLHAYKVLRAAKGGRVLATVTCEGYEYHETKQEGV